MYVEKLLRTGECEVERVDVTLWKAMEVKEEA